MGSFFLTFIVELEIELLYYIKARKAQCGSLAQLVRARP